MIFKPNIDAIPITLPNDAEALGCIMPNLNDNDDEDILQVILPNGFGIDVGNYSHGVHPYNLHIVAFKNNDFNDKVKTWNTTNPFEAAKIVEDWCKENK